MNSVNVGKFNLGFGAVGLVEHLFHETGWCAVFQDPDGNMVGLYEGAADTSARRSHLQS